MQWHGKDSGIPLCECCGRVVRLLQAQRARGPSTRGAGSSGGNAAAAAAAAGPSDRAAAGPSQQQQQQQQAAPAAGRGPGGLAPNRVRPDAHCYATANAKPLTAQEAKKWKHAVKEKPKGKAKAKAKQPARGGAAGPSRGRGRGGSDDSDDDDDDGSNDDFFTCVVAWWACSHLSGAACGLQPPWGPCMPA